MGWSTTYSTRSQYSQTSARAITRILTLKIPNLPPSCVPVLCTCTVYLYCVAVLCSCTDCRSVVKSYRHITHTTPAQTHTDTDTQDDATVKVITSAYAFEKCRLRGHDDQC